MSYLLTAAALLIELAFALIAGLFTLRLLLPMVGANFRNPVCQAVYRLSHPLVAPLGRIVKPVGRIDLASALLAWLSQCLKVLLLMALAGLLPSVAGLLVLGLAGWLDFLLMLGFWLILLRVLFSFVASGGMHPIVLVVHQLTEPLLGPLRRRLPPLGGFDLSPMLAMLLLILARILLVAPLHDLGTYLAQG